MVDTTGPFFVRVRMQNPLATGDYDYNTVLHKGDSFDRPVLLAPFEILNQTQMSQLVVNPDAEGALHRPAAEVDQRRVAGADLQHVGAPRGATEDRGVRRRQGPLPPAWPARLVPQARRSRRRPRRRSPAPRSSCSSRSTGSTARSAPA
jgi:hypothetical protein